MSMSTLQAVLVIIAFVASVNMLFKLELLP